MKLSQIITEKYRDVTTLRPTWLRFGDIIRSIETSNKVYSPEMTCFVIGEDYKINLVAGTQINGRTLFVESPSGRCFAAPDSLFELKNK